MGGAWASWPFLRLLRLKSMFMTLRPTPMPAADDGIPSRTIALVSSDRRRCRMPLIALEEHFAWDPASVGNPVATWLQSHDPVAHQRLYDRGPLRLEQMDAAGIDFQ